MICGECRDPRRCKITEPPEDAESKVALQAAKLRERSLQLGNERKKLKRSIKRPEPQESAGLEVPTAVGEEEPSPKELTVRPFPLPSTLPLRLSSFFVQLSAKELRVLEKFMMDPLFPQVCFWF